MMGRSCLARGQLDPGSRAQGTWAAAYPYARGEGGARVFAILASVYSGLRPLRITTRTMTRDCDMTSQCSVTLTSLTYTILKVS